MKIKLRVLTVMLSLFLISGCAGTEKNIKLDPKNPVTISVWHYYNGTIMNNFLAMINDFNETLGLEKGIIVEGSAHGSVTELERAVIASANKDIGSLDMPNIFASYADTAYQAEKLGLLANLDDYLSKEEQAEYLDSYIEEGKIGLNGELRIFPIAKSTEVMMVNETDWLPFAEANGFTYDDLNSMDGVSKVAEAYYNWTDAQTPDIANDGESFFGRDSMANMFIIVTKEFGEEIFKVEAGNATININTQAMRSIWDNYYVPYISGYFSSYGRYRSDDAKVGDILAYVGSTSSASYFPSEVNDGEKVYPVDAKVLPVPHFKDGAKVLVQQGAGMVVTKSTQQEEYASVEFLKWFTEKNTNIEFSCNSGYMPVKKEALDFDYIKSLTIEKNIPMEYITEETLRVAIEEIKQSEMYTNKAFNGGAEARAILDRNLQDKAVADRAEVLLLIESGKDLKEAVAEFNSEQKFNAWLEDTTVQLNDVLPTD